MKMRHSHRVILTVLAVAVGVPVAVIGCAVFMDYNFKLFQGALVAGIESSIASFGPARMSYSAVVNFEYGVPSDVTILVPAPTLGGEGIPPFERALAEVEPPPEIVRNEKGTFLKLTRAHAHRQIGSTVSLYLKVQLDQSGRRKEFLQREFDLDSAVEDRPGYWVFVDSGDSARYLILTIWVKAADGEWIKSMEYRLNDPPDGWHLVEGEVEP